MPKRPRDAKGCSNLAVRQASVYLWWGGEWRADVPADRGGWHFRKRQGDGHSDDDNDKGAAAPKPTTPTRTTATTMVATAKTTATMATMAVTTTECGTFTTTLLNAYTSPMYYERGASTTTTRSNICDDVHSTEEP